MALTMGSLFAGIGGFDLGFERAGFKTVWQVEINEYCRKVLARHFPDAERYADIRECGAHNLKPVDVICGGFPCQDISNAGLRAGIDGERSGLWREMHRIICELRPKYVVVENVAALLGRGIGRVLGDLSEIGYDAEWRVISAADVGAPHLRERIWIVAYAVSKPAQSDRIAGIVERAARTSEGAADQRQRVWNAADCGSEDVADAASVNGGQGWPRRSSGNGSDREGQRAEALADGHDAQGIFAGCIDAQEWSESRERSTGPRDAGGGGQWAIEPNVGRVAHGVPKRVDRLRALGNAVVPQIPEMIARRIAEVL